jgi:hypothetical protein
MADSACTDMLLMDAGKLRVVAEEGVDWLRVEQESRSVLVVKDALVEILPMFEGRKSWTWAAVRFRWAWGSILGRRVLLEAQTV